MNIVARSTFLGAILTMMIPCSLALDVEVGQQKVAGHTILNLRKAMNLSCYDDGVADNGKGGWTDEGLNDFHTYPALSFGQKERHGYFFDVVDPASNSGHSLVATGTDACWPTLPRSIVMKGLAAKGKYLFVLHSEGRIDRKARSGGTLRLKYSDGTTAEMKLRMGKELADWYQGRWWSNYEELKPGAPELLKKAGFNQKAYEKMGGKDFAGTVMRHTNAVRWPVIRGYNTVSRNWSIPVVFWALRWENPHPGKTISAIEVKSSGACVIGIAGITVTDKDFSLDRQTKGKLSKPRQAPAGHFDRIAAKFGDTIKRSLIAKDWTKGIRGVSLRSDLIVTLRIDQAANFPKLKTNSCYRVVSSDDQDFQNGVAPVKVSKFSRGSRYRAVTGDQYKVYADHWMHLEMPKPFKWGKHYRVEVRDGLLPESRKLKRSVRFSLMETPNPSFKINQVGYTNSARVKLIYLSSYLGDGKPVDLEAFKTFEIRNAKTHAPVFKGKIKKHVERDIQGLDKLYMMDVSNFGKEGRFYAWVDGLGRSYPFLNGAQAAKAMYEVTHRGIFFQRSGFEMKQPWAGKWERPMAHNKVYVTSKNLTHPIKPVDPGKKSSGDYYVAGGPKEIHGGHYDAGDYDLRPMHINIPELLLSLYEALPEKFYDGQAQIKETGNGIPDILDEAAWNLLSLEYFQDYAAGIRKLKGGVAPGMETYKHPGPGEGMGRDPLPYYMRKVTPLSSYAAAAVFAQAGRVFKPFDSKRSERYLKRARAAYEYATQNEGAPQPLLSSGRTDQGESWDGRSLAAARCWAAGQLYSTSGDKKYLDDFAARYRKAGGQISGSVSGWAMAWPILMTKRDVPSKLRTELRERLIRNADQKLAWVEEQGRNGYRASTLVSGGWGVTSCVVRNIEAVTRAYLLTREQKYLDAIATSVDFTLGMNPSEMSWMTGAGSDTPMDPCNINCLDDGIEEPNPGILIYGPTGYYQDPKGVLYPDKTKMGFYRRVVDVWGFIAQCEYTVWETQAPFLFAVGTLLPDAQK